MHKIFTNRPLTPHPSPCRLPRPAAASSTLTMTKGTSWAWREGVGASLTVLLTSTLLTPTSAAVIRSPAGIEPQAP